MPQKSIPEVVKQVLPGVVSITISKYLTVYQQRPSPFWGWDEFFAVPRGKKKIKVGGGSGFIIDPDGLIFTNRHVVQDPSADYVVTLNDGRQFKAEVLTWDPTNDLAIIKIKARELPTIELGDSSKLELGQSVVAIGNTLGFHNTVSAGVISGIGRSIIGGDAMSGEKIRLSRLIQTDAAINPGNSGGPLIDLEGKAIGINTAVVFLAENVGFALPINAAKRNLKDVREHGRIRVPFLGLRYVLVTPQIKKQRELKIDQGALLLSDGGNPSVVIGGPAEQAGCQEGDVILEVNSEKITLDNSLDAVLQDCRVGDEIELKILRKEKEKILKVKLGERKIDE